MTLARLFPQSHDFYADFGAVATIAAAAAELLVAIFREEGGVEDKVRRLRDLERSGDEIVHEVLSALGRSLVPMISREDVRDLARRLDDFVDYIEEAGRRRSLYQLDQPSPIAQRLAALVQAQAVILTQSMSLLAQADQDEILKEHLAEIHRLENEADDVLSDALATLYEGARDVAGVVLARQWGDIYGLLEDATDRAERVAHTLEGIVDQRL
jgi:uncharacterized protein Yka (UPF0111/DUF47 family)